MSTTPTPKHELRNRKLLATLAIATVLMSVITLVSYNAWGPKSTPNSQYPGGHVGENVVLNMSSALSHGVGLALTINVSDHGRLLSSFHDPNDLLDDNFFKVLIGLFDNAQSGGFTSQSLMYTTGSSDTVYFWGVDGGGYGNDCYTYAFGCELAGQGGLIEVGTGSAAVARADYVLTTPYQSFVSTTTACVASSTDSVTISASENANTGATIKESGLFYSQTWSPASGYTRTYMLAHDTFTGVVVSAGNTITVQYTLSLSSPGFNFNLCNYLAAMLTQPNGAYNTEKSPTTFLSYTDTLSRVVGYSMSGHWAGSTAAVAPIQDLASPNPISSDARTWGTGQTVNTVQICVGTGVSSFTPTSYALSAQVACNYVNNVNYDSAGNAYVTANVVVSPGATISEAALYFTIPYSCVNLVTSGTGSCGSVVTTSTMWLASTFTGQVVPTGQSIGITFQIAASGGS